MAHPGQVPPQIGNYWLMECLGSGYSGSIYKAQHLYTHQVVALKVQNVHHECPTNLYERGFYPHLQGGVGIPTLHGAGVHGQWDYLAIDLLGSSLDSFHRKNGAKPWDLRSVCCLAIQVIKRLEFMHGRGILHRDIQLGNCVVGLPPNDRTIYMIDFGFSKLFIDPRTREHIPDSKAKRDFIGNYWFSSIRVHCQGKVPSRRDDMEALALMLIHLLTPEGLPWTRNGVPKTDEAHDQLKKEKKRARSEDLCRDLPQEFEEFLRYCRRLKFLQCPDYQKWIDEFQELARSHGFPPTDDFIWPPPALTFKQAPRRSLAPPPDDVENILKQLTNLNIGERQVLGDRGNALPVQLKQPPKKAPQAEPLVISSGSEQSDLSLGVAATKATKLLNLAQRISNASDNQALAACVEEFAAILKANPKRKGYVIKEGFTVLDALHKQLKDPSVFIAPMRTSRTRSDRQPEPELDARQARRGVMNRLKDSVMHTTSNSGLATLVEEFGRTINNSPQRTVTKDGFLFLSGLAFQLQVTS